MTSILGQRPSRYFNRIGCWPEKIKKKAQLLQLNTRPVPPFSFLFLHRLQYIFTMEKVKEVSIWDKNKLDFGSRQGKKQRRSEEMVKKNKKKNPK